MCVQNMAAHTVYGVRRSEHITPVLEDLHWLPVGQRVVFKAALSSLQGGLEGLEVCLWRRSSLS